MICLQSYSLYNHQSQHAHPSLAAFISITTKQGVQGRTWIFYLQTFKTINSIIQKQQENIHNAAPILKGNKISRRENGINQVLVFQKHNMKGAQSCINQFFIIEFRQFILLFSEKCQFITIEHYEHLLSPREFEFTMRPMCQFRYQHYKCPVIAH